MMKLNYLSEVEAAWMQREATVAAKPKRLFPVFMTIGKDAHGFAAVLDEVIEQDGGWHIKFSPVSDVCILKGGKERLRTYWDKETGAEKWDEFDVRYDNRSPDDLARFLLDRSQWKDHDKICEQEPMIGEE